jgi:hypothetical protein
MGADYSNPPQNWGFYLALLARVGPGRRLCVRLG